MLHRLTLCQMAEQVRARKISPVELVDAHLKQIEEHNPKLNAFVRVLHDEARVAAKSAEDALAENGDIGPLHGVPVTIKDSFDMAGIPTTCGSRFFQDLPASRDAVAVLRLKGAGAIPLGRTNTPEFLSSYETDNYVTGRTNNPWNLNCTPGGSSGGESAAISSYCSAGGIGSDGGGSVRVPAHFCGIAGLKPTPGRVPATGHMPEICHPGGLLGVAGPMARTAADVRLLFQVLAGYDDQDPFSAPVPIRTPDLSGMCIGLMEQWYAVPIQGAMRRAAKKAAVCLEQLGFTVQPFQPTELESAPNIWWFFFGELPARITKELIAGREDQAHWTGTEFLDRALSEPEPTARQVLANLAIRDKMRGSLLRQMKACPVLLMPACGVAAFEHRQRRYQADGKQIGLFEAMMPVTPFNLLGMPGLVIPFDFDDRGMPVGIQLVGRPFEEELLLALAVRLEEARGPFPGPAGY